MIFLVRSFTDGLLFWEFHPHAGFRSPTFYLALFPCMSVKTLSSLVSSMTNSPKAHHTSILKNIVLVPCDFIYDFASSAVNLKWYCICYPSFPSPFSKCVFYFCLPYSLKRKPSLITQHNVITCSGGIRVIQLYDTRQTNAGSSVINLGCSLSFCPYKIYYFSIIVFTLVFSRGICKGLLLLRSFSLVFISVYEHLDALFILHLCFIHVC